MLQRVLLRCLVCSVQILHAQSPWQTPSIVSPTSGRSNLGSTVTIRWTSLKQHLYTVQVSEQLDFSSLILNSTLYADALYTEITVGGLDVGTTYHVRARLSGFDYVGGWSQVCSFSTAGSTGKTFDALRDPNRDSEVLPAQEWNQYLREMSVAHPQNLDVHTPALHFVAEYTNETIGAGQARFSSASSSSVFSARRDGATTSQPVPGKSVDLTVVLPPFLVQPLAGSAEAGTSNRNGSENNVVGTSESGTYAATTQAVACRCGLTKYVVHTNPVATLPNVLSSGSEPQDETELTMYTVDGSQVLSTTLAAATSELCGSFIDLSMLQNGVYSYSLRNQTSRTEGTICILR